MAQTDSFIDEVTEEVRRDRLYRLLRRYGWVGVLAVLLIVGSSAWFEWQKARNRAAAAAFGDSLLAAMALEDPAGRAAALGAVVAQGDAGALTRLLQAEAALANTTDDAARAAGLATLAAIAADTTVSPLWRDLAQLHRLAAGGGDGAGDLSTDARAAALAELARPGRPFRPLALEQIALDRLAAGDRAGALADFTALAIDSAAPSGLRGRAQQMMLMLDDGPAAAAPAQE